MKHKVILLIIIIIIALSAGYIWIAKINIEKAESQELVDLKNNKKWLEAGITNNEIDNESSVEQIKTDGTYREGLPKYALKIAIPDEFSEITDGWDDIYYANSVTFYDRNSGSTAEVIISTLSPTDALKNAIEMFNKSGRYSVYKHSDSIMLNDNIICEKYEAEDVYAYYNVYYATKEINQKTILVKLNIRYKGGTTPISSEATITEIFNNAQIVNANEKAEEGSFIIYG